MLVSVKPGQLWKWKADRLAEFNGELVLVVSCVHRHNKLFYKCIDFGFDPPHTMFYDFGGPGAVDCSFELVVDT